MAVTLTEALRRIAKKEKEIRKDFQRVSRKIETPGFSRSLQGNEYMPLKQALLGTQIALLAQYKKTLRTAHKKSRAGDAQATRKLKKMLKDFA